MAEIIIFGSKLTNDEVKNTIFSSQLLNNFDGNLDAYKLEAPHRSSSKIEKGTLHEDGLVYYEFEDGSHLFLSPDEVVKLCISERSAANFRSSQVGTDQLFLSVTYTESNTRDGWLSKVFVKIACFLDSKQVTSIMETVGSNTALSIAKKLESSQPNPPGLYIINAQNELELPTKPLLENQHYFLYIHGTNSNAKSAFFDAGTDKEKALQNRKITEAIQANFDTRILALEHPTLTETPFENVLLLMKALPKEVTLTMMSHSRGGIIVDTLLLCIDAVKYKKTDAVYDFLMEENRMDDGRQFKLIVAELDKRKINIAQIIKVASPGAGTTLLSDNIVNLLRAMTISAQIFSPGVSAAIELTEKLIVSILQSKDKKEVLSGIEIMTPENAFLDLINQYKLTDEPKVFLLAGRSRFAYNVIHSLKFLLSRLVIQDDSDMVVNTVSMCQGLKFTTPIVTEVSDSNIHHSSYFYQENTASLVVEAILSKGDFSPSSNVRSCKIQKQRGIEYGDYFCQTITGLKPITVVIPGMMASSLYEGKNRIWIDYGDMVGGSLLTMDVNNSYELNGILKSAYGSFCDFLLNNGHDVYVIPYDWRLSYESQLQRFQDHLNHIIQKANNQPIRIVSHSKGGLLFRHLILKNFKMYQKLSNTTGFRWIMLGTPWYGSYAAVKTIIGQSKTLRNLRFISGFVSTKRLLSVFHKYPGILEMLPLNLTNQQLVGNDALDFTSKEVWNDIYDNLDKNNNYKWLTPPDDQLSNVGLLKSEIGKIKFGDIDQLIGSDIYLDKSKIYYIAGNCEDTPYKFNSYDHEAWIEDIEYKGDSTVTWVEGIPEKFSDNNIYYTNSKHDRLLDDNATFRSILQLINTGQCNIGKTPPTNDTRGTIVRKNIEPVYKTKTKISSNTRDENINELFGYEETNNSISDIQALNVKLSHGDLMFSDGPLMIGHFANESITKAERVLDKRLDEYLTKKFNSKSYPNSIGESLYVFKSAYNKPKGGLVLGLGETFRFSEFGLSESVKKGVITAVLQHSDSPEGTNPPLFTLSTLLIGTAFGDLSIAASINAIIEGVYDANKYIESLNASEKGNYQIITNLEFIEIFKDKALGAYYELKRLHKIEKINFEPLTIFEKTGRIEALSANYGIEKWNHLRIRINGGCPIFKGQDQNCELTCNVCDCHSKADEGKTDVSQHAKKITQCSNNRKYLEFDLGRGIARDENRKNYISLETTHAYLEQIKRETDQDKLWDNEIAKTLFEMLIPNDFKRDIRSQANLVLNLDVDAASIPWELIQDTKIAEKPICVNAGMLRRLNIANYRLNPRYSDDQKVLIIGDPNLNGSLNYGQLSGAVAEASAIISSYAQYADYMNIIEGGLISSNSGDILKAIYAHESRAIHIAAHGDFDHNDSSKSGIVIGYNADTGQHIYITAANIAQMDVIPEFVFINTCYSGKNTKAANELSYNTYGFAANVGTEFMAAGVKAVIVAGWPVYDDLAQIFAQEFYKNFLLQKPFGESVQLAREACYDADPNRNTWGAYQCYGDPNFVLRLHHHRSNTIEYTLAVEVLNDLSQINNKLDIYKEIDETFRTHLDNIIDAIDHLKIDDGIVIEKLAEVYNKLGNLEKAKECYDQLSTLEKAVFSLKALEQKLNVWAKMVVKNCSKENFAASISELDEIIENLAFLNKIGESSERYSLLGSTLKRKAFIEKKYGAMDITSSLKSSIDYYSKGVNLIMTKKGNVESYSELNLILLQYIQSGLSPDLKSRIKKINKNSELTGDYYIDITNFNIDLTEYILLGAISGEKDDKKILKILIDSFVKIWKISGSLNHIRGEIEQLEMLEEFLTEKKKKRFILNLIDKLKAI